MLWLISSETVLRCSGAVAICWLLTGRQGEVPTGIAKQARLQGLIAVTRRQQQEYIAALNWVLHPKNPLSPARLIAKGWLAAGMPNTE